MIGLLHRLFGAHVADPERSRWERGHYASVCIRCGREMVQMPGLPWQVGKAE